MSLTKTDLKLIDERIEKRIDAALDKFFNKLLPILNQFPTRQELYENFATKKDLQEIRTDLNELKDHVISLEDKFDKGYHLLKLQLDQNTERLNNTIQILGL